MPCSALAHLVNPGLKPALHIPCLIPKALYASSSPKARSHRIPGIDRINMKENILDLCAWGLTEAV